MPTLPTLPNYQIAKAFAVLPFNPEFKPPLHQVTVTRPAFTWTSHEVQHGGLYNGSIYESPGTLCGHVGRVLAKPCMYNLQNNVAWITVIKLAFVPKDPSVHRLIALFNWIWSASWTGL